MEEFFHPAFPGGKFQPERFFHRFAGLVPTTDPDIQCQRTDRVVQRQFQRITFSRLENSRIQTFPQVWIRVPEPPEIAFFMCPVECKFKSAVFRRDFRRIVFADRFGCCFSGQLHAELLPLARSVVCSPGECPAGKWADCIGIFRNDWTEFRIGCSFPDRQTHGFSDAVPVAAGEVNGAICREAVFRAHFEREREQAFQKLRLSLKFKDQVTFFFPERNPCFRIEACCSAVFQRNGLIAEQDFSASFVKKFQNSAAGAGKSDPVIGVLRDPGESIECERAFSAFPDRSVGLPEPFTDRTALQFRQVRNQLESLFHITHDEFGIGWKRDRHSAPVFAEDPDFRRGRMERIEPGIPDPVGVGRCPESLTVVKDLPVAEAVPVFDQSLYGIDLIAAAVGNQETSVFFLEFQHFPFSGDSCLRNIQV